MNNYDTFAELYDSEWARLTEDLPFYSQLGEAYGSPILELACGTGRIAFHLAEKGYAITGVDNSTAMLNAAKRKLDRYPLGVQNSVELIKADMSNFALDKTFNLILIPINSFLLLTDKATQERCLRCVRNHMTHTGALAIDVYSPRFELIAQEPKMNYVQTFFLPKSKKLVSQWEYTERDMANQTMDIDFLYEEYGFDGKVSRKHKRLKMAIIFRYEMQLLLEKAGFRVVSFYGGYDRTRFDANSLQMLYIAQKDHSIDSDELEATDVRNLQLV